MTGVVIQARLGSTRLPGKVLLPIGSRPLLGHILDRLTRLAHPVTVVVATTVKPQDDPIEAYCRERGVAVFRGSEENVLKRYHDCALSHGFDQVVRLTADNPFVDVEELDRLIELQLTSGADYSAAVAGLPVGVGAEIFSWRALALSLERATLPHHFEHVNEYLLEHPAEFRLATLEVPPAKRAPARLTVDTEEDYRRAQFVVAHAQSDPVATPEAIALAARFRAP